MSFIRGKVGKGVARGEEALLCLSPVLVRILVAILDLAEASVTW
jgi:hypothetical protein